MQCLLRDALGKRSLDEVALNKVAMFLSIAIFIEGSVSSIVDYFRYSSFIVYKSCILVYLLIQLCYYRRF